VLDEVYSAPGWLRRLKVGQVVTALVIAALAVVMAPLWLGYLPNSLVYFRELRKARSAMERIEDFRRTTGALPEDLCRLGLRCDEAARLRYDRRQNGVYILSFMTPTHGFFSTLNSDSGARSWSAGQ
jgi:hypothetical protein